MSTEDRPEWWEWDLELSPHLLKRMADRRFNEVDLRLMLETASSFVENKEEDRWSISCQHDGRPWEVIVEPALGDELLVVVTAYPLD